MYRECIRSVSRRMYPSYVSHTHLGMDLEVEVQIHKEYMWIHDDTPRYTEYIQNTEKIRILTTIHAKYTKIRIEGKVSHLGGKTEPFPGNSSDLERVPGTRSIATEFSECTILDIELQEV